MQTTFNREEERKKIVAELLAATTKIVRIVLWDDQEFEGHGYKSIERIGHFSNDPMNLQYGCIKIAKGKKLAAWTLRWIDEALDLAEKLESPLITVEQITEEEPY